MTKWLSLFILITATSPVLAEPILLVLGEEHRLTSAESRRLWIESPAKLQGRARGEQVFLKPLKPGRVNIQTGTGPREVEIISPETAQTRKILLQATQKMLGLNVQVFEGQLQVEGRLHRIEDYLSFLKGLRGKAQWVLRARMSPDLQSRFKKAVQEELSLQQPPGLVFTDRIQWLVGASGPKEIPAEQIERLGIEVLKDPDSVQPEPVVRVEIAVAEVRRDALREYGISWPSSAEAKLLPDSSWSRQELLFSGKAFEKTGHGRLLARPTLLCRSGKEAEFVAGGEFPIRIFNARLQDVVWKRYGIVVNVKPKADRAGRMSIALSVEISSIDDSRKIDGIPGILTNRVASHFDLSRPRVIALSGLIKQEDGRHREGLPGLSGLPILGPLFSSREWREHRTELVIFVRPEIAQETL